MFERSWVLFPALDTRLTFIHIDLLSKYKKRNPPPSAIAYLVAPEQNNLGKNVKETFQEVEKTIRTRRLANLSVAKW